MNYKEMYQHLFNALTHAVLLLQKAQLETEEMYIESKPQLKLVKVAESLSPCYNKPNKREEAIGLTAVFTSMGRFEIIDRVYASETRAALSEKFTFIDPLKSLDELAPRKEEFNRVEFIFSTWGMPALAKEQILEYFPKLKAVFYAAGSVQGFARPFMECGVRVFCAADANAIPVIEYSVAQILLANKGFYQASRIYKGGSHAAAKEYFSHFAGNFGNDVGLLGAGKIGRGVILMLKQFKLNVSVFDPFLPQEEAKKLGVTLCSLDEIFSKCFVVSNHLANNEQTQKMLTYAHFSKMDDYGVFINTGRGAQVVEDDLVRALREKPTRTAILDVTFPEPVQEGHPFYELDNVILTPHIAGSAGDEVARMGEFMCEESFAFISGGNLKYEVTPQMLETMA